MADPALFSVQFTKRQVAALVWEEFGSLLIPGLDWRSRGSCCWLLGLFWRGLVQCVNGRDFLQVDFPMTCPHSPQHLFASWQCLHTVQHIQMLYVCMYVLYKIRVKWITNITVWKASQILSHGSYHFSDHPPNPHTHKNSIQNAQWSGGWLNWFIVLFVLSLF